MSEPKKLKEIFAEASQTFGVSKKRLWDTVKRAAAGLGNGWISRLYKARPIDAEEAKRFNVPSTSIVLTRQGASAPCLVIHPSTYLDKDRNVCKTACASQYSYLSRIGLSGKPTIAHPKELFEE